MRCSGTRVVDYESGRIVRIDTAARMSVLDGVRHLNQSIMEEVGRQFGADGVEIDAHMLCAEDHVPYQGEQYSNEEFEQIQDSLQRPFGEWNCRHSWHPIMMGISPRTYTDDELSEMRRYSTEPIEIDGRTKTRYQWSQEMRRVETRIRQVKDTATLARYAGDDVLRRQCQQQIGILNERYKTLAQGAGLKPEYQRTYVAGFRDAKGKLLTVFGIGGTIKTKQELMYDVKPFPGKTTVKDALEGTNPNRNSGNEGYMYNCQRCVVTYEARRRGFDVQAKPLEGVLSEDKLAKNQGWLKAFEGIRTMDRVLTRDDISQNEGKTPGAAYIQTRIEKTMSEYGDGTRAVVSLQWKTPGLGGHVFIVEQIAGKTHFFDPQTGSMNCVAYLKRSEAMSVQLVRVDDKPFTALAKEMFEW